MVILTRTSLLPLLLLLLLPPPLLPTDPLGLAGRANRIMGPDPEEQEMGRGRLAGGTEQEEGPEQEQEQAMRGGGKEGGERARFMERERDMVCGLYNGERESEALGGSD